MTTDNAPHQAPHQTRPNLAKTLKDKEARQACLHPSKKNTWQALWRMYEPVRKSPKMVWAHLGYAITFGLQPLLSALVTYVLVGLLEAPGTKPSQMLITAGVYGLVFLLCAAGSRMLYHRNYSWFTWERLRLLRQVNLKMMSMDYGLYENAAFMDDVETAYWSLGSNNDGLEGTFHTIFELGGDLVAALLLGILLSFLSPLIALLGLVFVVVTFYAQAHVGAYKHQKRMEIMQVSRRLSLLQQEAANFKAGKDLRLYRMADKFLAVFEPVLKMNMALYRAFTNRELKLSFVERLALVAIDLVAALVLVQQYIAGRITMADFVMLLSAVVLFAHTMQEVARRLAQVKTQTLYVQDAFDFMDAKLDSTGDIKDIPGEGPASVVFEDVSFAYPGSDKQVLSKLSFAIKPGERIALVGVNGAGKTTLVKLLLGLYLPDSGRILINGIDTASLDQHTLFSLFGVIFQEVEPLALTIAQTVAASTDAIDRERVQHCLTTAGLWDKVASLEKGMDSELLKIIHDDGVILSGGENQKLMIARALYRRGTRVMVMDEPTAALDALAEQAIYQQFDSILGGKTALFISHRLASTRFCDRILLLDGGSISQQGSHEELLAKPGLYRTLFETQGKYYKSQEAHNG